MNNNINHLLESVSLITKKYEDLARITGENFNIFSIMSMENNERYTHSAIIGELLNPKGSHGQGSVFLKLFFQEITILKNSELDFDNTKIILEEHIGQIDHEYSSGGFIDIVIKDNKNTIVIENKIYAEDQYNQLVRYKNYYPNCILLYLNLFGTEPSNKSKGNLEIKIDFHIISYKNEVSAWLEKCFKEAVQQPILRETIKQYITLIKKLTNQPTNNNMSEEIVNLILRNDNNINTANQIANSLNIIKMSFVNRLNNILKLATTDEKKEIDIKVKEVLINSYLQIIPFFPNEGIKVMRFDIVLNEKNEVFAVQVEAYPTKICICYWSNNKTLENLIKNKKPNLGQSEFNYYSKDLDIYNDVKNHLFSVLEIIKSDNFRINT